MVTSPSGEFVKLDQDINCLSSDQQLCYQVTINDQIVHNSSSSSSCGPKLLSDGVEMIYRYSDCSSAKIVSRDMVSDNSRSLMRVPTLQTLDMGGVTSHVTLQSTRDSGDNRLDGNAIMVRGAAFIELLSTGDNCMER